MLCGRGAERRRIDRVVRRTRQGVGATLVLRGEPGIGKTALSAYAAESASDMRVLVARGLEAESNLAHAGLFDLLRPLQPYLAALPAAQRGSLGVVLRLEDGPVPDPLTVGVATLGLLSAAAAEWPLLVVIDDLHLLDSASLSVLRFAARRLADDPVAFVVTTRGDELLTDDAEVLELGGLDADGVVSLLRWRHGEAVTPGVAQRLVELTGGNPLAIEELAARLSIAELRGDVPLDVTQATGLRAHAHFREQVSVLPEGARRALLVCGLSGSGDTDEITAALDRCGHGRRDLLAAEASGLVQLSEGRVLFRHPLVRTAVLDSASAAERRAAHAALASTASSDAAQVWHRAEAAEGSDRATAAALEALAVDAERAGAYVEAARAWDRAVTLTPAGEDIAGRLLGAGRARHLAGRSSEALPLLDSALEHATDPTVRLAIQQERGHILVWQAQPELVHRTFLEEGRRALPEQPFLGASALVLATLGALQTGDLADAEASAAAAHDAARAVGGLLETSTGAIHGLTRALRGDFEGEGAMLALEGLADAALPMADAVPATLGILSWAGLMLTIVEAHEAAEQLLSATVGFARDRRAVAALPAPLVNWAELRLAVGDWETTATLAHEALQLAVETGDTGHRLRALIVLGQLGALRGGDGSGADELGEAVALARQHRLRSYEMDAESALGLRALGTGDVVRALRHLLRCAELATGSGLCHPYFARFAPDLVEAHVRSGDPAAAGAVLAPFEWNAAQSLGNRGKASAARCRGILAEDGWEQHFEMALKHHAALPLPFEQARTELSFGERLRRSGQRRRARQHLSAALATFERLGAEPWAVRARDELRASGGRLSAEDHAVGVRLTPQELRIARAVSRGQTNREVAADLFLSPKTVENQLTRIYAKFGVRSRTQLAARMAERDGWH